MAYTTDGAGNYFVGTWSQPPSYTAPYSSHSIDADPVTFTTDMQALKTVLGWKHLNFVGDWTTPNASSTGKYFTIKFADDPNNSDVPRYQFSSSNITIFADNGTSSLGNQSFNPNPYGNNSRHSLVCTANNIAIVSHSDTTGTPAYNLHYMGSLQDPNPTAPYSDWERYQVYVVTNGFAYSPEHSPPGSTVWATVVMTDGRGVPDIVCTDAQTAGASGWSTNAHLMHNAPNGLGETGIRIGQMQNIIFAQTAGLSNGQVYTLNTTYDAGSNEGWLVCFREFGTGTEKRKVLVRMDIE